MEWFFVGAFALSHLASPHVFRLQHGARRRATSFAGGLAAAYVCLHLIPEIDAGSNVLGQRIYLVLMVGFAAYYGLAMQGAMRMERDGDTGAFLGLHLVIAAVYSFLLVYTLGEQLPRNFALTAAFAAMMGLHLLTSDFGLLEVDEDRFRKGGRYLLALAALAGFACAALTEFAADVVDFLTALLAGSMLFRVFRNELPEFRRASYGAFLLGMGLLLVMHLLLGAAR